MICAYFPGVDDNFILVIHHGEAYRGNTLRITEESMSDALQKVFVCQKIVTEMWPTASSIGHVASLPIFAWQRNNAARPHRRRSGSSVPLQEF
jgi:hypothetical protein